MMATAARPPASTSQLTREQGAIWLSTRVRTHTVEELLADEAAVAEAVRVALVDHRRCGCQWTVLVEQARAALMPAPATGQIGWDL